MDVIADLAIACAQQASRRQTPCAKADPCYELFCRALAHPPDEAAWHALVTQYGRLVRHWLGDYADDDACQEVFVRFWKALHSSETPLSTRFPTTGAILQYLKQCVLSVRIELGRAAAQQAQVEAALRTAVLAETTWLYGHTEHRSDVDDDFQQVIAACLQTPQEQVLFDLRYHYDLLPREIQVCRPDLFPTLQTVYRTHEALLKRLRRNAALRRLWEGQSGVLNGGNSADSSV